MKYYSLYIDFEPSWNTYNKVSKILQVTPEEFKKSKFDTSGEPSIWQYQIQENELDSPTDFINILLDLIDPNLSNLASIGIQKSNILIWLVYEYEEQCALGFNPSELERIGKTGIALNIDCHKAQ